MAVAVSQLDHYKNVEVHIYETRKLEEVGTGLTIFNRTWELLETLGCQELTKKQAVIYSRVESRVFNIRYSMVTVFSIIERVITKNSGSSFLNLTLPGTYERLSGGLFSQT